MNEKPIEVLMMDDNPFLLESMMIYLKKAGFMVDCAPNGRIGLEKILKDPQRYQVILVDIEMPVMDGMAFAKSLRENQDLLAKPIPLIAVTGSQFRDDPRMPLFSDMIKKPFSYSQLTSLILRTLKEINGEFFDIQ